MLALPIVFFSGKNYLKSAWLSLQQRNLNIDVPISIGILTLFRRSIFEILSGVGAGYLDSLAGLVFFLLIGKWFQKITFNHLSFERYYKSYFSVAALLQNGETAPIQNLKKGDIIIINKELIPADGILLQGQGSIDYSFVTGELAALAKKNKGDQIFAGGKQLGEAVEIKTTKTVSHSYLTQLWNDAVFSKEGLTQHNQTQFLADRVGKYFTYVILTIAFLTLFYWLTIDVGIAVNAFTAVLIIACWAQSLGTAIFIMLIATSWGGMLNGLLTLRGAWDRVRTDPILKFMVVAITAYGMATFEGPMLSIKSVNAISHFTD